MDGNDELSPAEIARQKRRDRDADAAARAGMNTGLAKQFKQVLDSQRKRALEDSAPDRDTAAPGPADSRPDGGRSAPRKKRRRGREDR